MQSLTFELEIVTPLVLSGASQLEAELRPNSIKNMMRWWYRAGNNQVNNSKQESKEFELFGSTERASKFLPRIKRNKSNTKIDIASIDTDTFNKLPNGIKYLTFPFRPQRENNFNPHRSQILPTSYFPFSLTFFRGMSSDDKNSILASFWLLLFLGGIGSRSRRGLGSLRIKNEVTHSIFDLTRLQFNFFNGIFEDFPQFLTCNLQIALTLINSLYPAQRSEINSFTNLFSTKNKIYFWKTPFPNWEAALNKAGGLLQKFRSFRNPRNFDDYDSVSDFLINKNKEPTQYERAAFGLPININYGSLGNKKAIVEGGFKNARNEDDDHNRRSSPLFIKVLKITESKFALLFLYLPAKLLPDGESLKIKAKNGHREKDYCDSPDFSIVEEFLSKNIIPNAEEISF